MVRFARLVQRRGRALWPAFGLQVILRLAGPVLLGLALLAVRNRV
jgi:hypothetical protein